MWICVRSKDAQKQLAGTSLRCLVCNFCTVVNGLLIFKFVFYKYVVRGGVTW